MVRFTPDFLQRVRDALPVSSVVGKVVRLHRAGHMHKGLCPFHKEKSPSFTVQDEKQFYHCFGCSAHGDIFRFVQEQEGLNFPEAVERLAGLAGVPMPVQVETQESRAEQRERKTAYHLLEAACVWFEQQLHSTQGLNARRYMQERGMSEAIQKEFRIGFAPDSRAGLMEALKSQGFDAREMIAHGLLISPEAYGNARGGTPYSRFRSRLMFPIQDRRGKVIAFGGRILGDGQPKYLNSPETPLFHKSHVFYNAHRARTPAFKAGQVLAVEGYTDVIALAQVGLAYAVAPLGTAVTASHLEMLWQMADEPVFCLDGDAAGLKAMRRVAELALPMLQPGKSLRFVLLPQGEDPDTLVRTQGAKAMTARMAAAKPLSEMLWQQVYTEQLAGRDATPERRAAIEKELQQLAEHIQQPGVRSYYQDFFREQCRTHLVQAYSYAGRQKQGVGKKTKHASAASGFGKKQAGVSPLHVGAEQDTAALVLLALTVRYPALLEESLLEEEFSALHFSHVGARKLHAMLLGYLAEGGALESAVLDAYIAECGGSALCAKLFAHPRVKLERVLQVQQHVLALDEVRQCWVSWQQQRNHALQQRQTQSMMRSVSDEITEEEWETMRRQLLASHE